MSMSNSWNILNASKVSKKNTSSSSSSSSSATGSDQNNKSTKAAGEADSIVPTPTGDTSASSLIISSTSNSSSPLLSDIEEDVVPAHAAVFGQNNFFPTTTINCDFDDLWTDRIRNAVTSVTAGPQKLTVENVFDQIEFQCSDNDDQYGGKDRDEIKLIESFIEIEHRQMAMEWFDENGRVNNHALGRLATIKARGPKNVKGAFKAWTQPKADVLLNATSSWQEKNPGKLCLFSSIADDILEDFNLHMENPPVPPEHTYQALDSMFRKLLAKTSKWNGEDRVGGTKIYPGSATVERGTFLRQHRKLHGLTARECARESCQGNAPLGAKPGYGRFCSASCKLANLEESKTDSCRIWKRDSEESKTEYESCSAAGTAMNLSCQTVVTVELLTMVCTKSGAENTL